MTGKRFFKEMLIFVPSLVLVMLWLAGEFANSALEYLGRWAQK